MRLLPSRPEITRRELAGSRRALKRGFSVVVPVARGEDGHAIRIRHAEVDRRAAEGKLAERVIGQQRQMRLSGAVVNHAQDALIRIDIGWSAAWDLRCHRCDDEDIAPRTHQTADDHARRDHDADVLSAYTS